MVRTTGGTLEVLRPEVRAALAVLWRRHRQGCLGQGTARPVAASGGPGRGLVRHGSLSDVQTRSGQGSAWFRVAQGAPARLVLLLPRQGTGVDARPLADLGAVHLSGVCQWPRLCGPATEEKRHRLRAGR